MALFTLIEILSLLLTVVVIGYIFSGIKRKLEPDLIPKWFDWNDFLYSAAIASPGIILHELAHKFVALAMGISAHYEVWVPGLVLGVLLKAFGSGFVILAPGYVVLNAPTAIQQSLTAFAGPAVNLVLWIGATLALKYSKSMSHNKAIALSLLKDMNKWLFIFNMIPLPPLDGFKVIQPLLGMIF